MSISKQCKLLSIPRSSYYHKPQRKWNLADEFVMQVIDRIYMEEPTTVAAGCWTNCTSWTTHSVVSVSVL